MPIQPIKPKNSVAVTAPAHIESYEIEHALRGAQYSFDRKLHDLRCRYHAEEVKLRDEYLSAVQAVTNGEPE